VLVIAEVLGIPAHDRDRYLGWVEAISGLSGILEGGEGFQAAGAAYVAARADMRDYLDARLDALRRAPAGDLLSDLVAAAADGEALSDEDIFGRLPVADLRGARRPPST
jgi:cytochrome P450